MKIMRLNKLSLFVALALSPLTGSFAATVYSSNGTDLDLYGSISVMGATNKAAQSIKTSQSKKNLNNTILTRVDFGIAGRTKINDTVYAIAASRWTMPATDGNDSDFITKEQYVGIDAQNYGTLTFGRGDNAFYSVAGVTDVFTQLDFNTNDHYVFGDYQQSQIMYSLSAMGIDFRLSAQLAADDVADSNVDLKNGAAFSLSTHLLNGIGFSYGLSYYDLKSDDSSDGSSFYADNILKMYSRADNDYDFAYSVQPSWKIDKGIAVTYGNFGEGLYVATNATVTKYEKFTHHLYSYEAIVNYTFENGFGTTLGYAIKRFNGANIQSLATLGFYYSLTPSFKLFAEGTLDINSKPERYYSNRQIKNMCIGENKALIGAQYLY